MFLTLKQANSVGQTADQLAQQLHPKFGGICVYP
jgi:hypothetical protein